MGNHVIRDRIWASKKLGRCSKSAAMAYPAIFLVADEWGRFEFRPHMIWSLVYGPRMDFAPLDTPSPAEVASWLAEYEREGLLERYHIDGDLAYWSGFEGRPPTKRRKSNHPDPQQFKRVRKTAGVRNATGAEPEDVRTKPELLARDVSKRLEQEREQEPPADLPADVRAETAIREGTVTLERKLLSAVSRLAGKVIPERDELSIMREVTAYKRGDGTLVAGRANPSGMSAERLEKSLSDALGWLADLDKPA